MQGMPIHLLTPKLNTNTSVKSAESSMKGEAAAIGENVEAATNSFEALLGQLMGAKTPTNELVLTSENQTSSKNSQNQNIENLENPSESAIIEHFQKNGVKFNPEELKSSIKLASTNTNLDELINSLKSKGNETINTQMMIDGVEVLPEDAMTTEEEKGSPLDFLIREGKSKDVVQVLKNPADKEALLKQLVSGEDFIGLRQELKGAKIGVEQKLDKSEIENQLKNQDFSNLLSKNAQNTEVGPKQNILASNLIRNTEDLAFGERKSKIGFDELKNPDMKIGSELSMIKESFIPNVQSINPQQTEVNVAGGEKVLDLSKINSANTTEIIKNISNYIEQNQIMNAESLDLNVKHDELGQFKIQVNRNVGLNNQSAMDLQIITSTTEGHEFFAKNEIGLIKTLSQAGIQLTDFKIVQSQEGSSMAQGDSRNNQNSQGQSSKEFMSSNGNDSQQGSDRRKELWQEARNLKERYGA